MQSIYVTIGLLVIKLAQNYKSNCSPLQKSVTLPVLVFFFSFLFFSFFFSFFTILQAPLLIVSDGRTSDPSAETTSCDLGEKGGEGSNMYEARRRRSFGIGFSLVCTLPFVARQCRYLHLGNVRELKCDPISQAIECGDCHLSNGWHRAFYRRTVKCANRRSVPPLHFNQIIPPLCASVALKDLTGLKGLISLLSPRVFFSLSVLASGSLMLFSELPLSRGGEMSRDVSWLDCHFALVLFSSFLLSSPCSINNIDK